VARLKDDDLSRLGTAISRSRSVLRHYRNERAYAVRKFLGPHYSEETSGDKRMPVNMLALFVQVVSRSLIAKNPRVQLTTWTKNLRSSVSVMQGWANREIERMKLAKTLQRHVLDSLFCMGITKVALATPSDSAMAGWQLKAGSAFAKAVDLDDFVCDMYARETGEFSFVGHKYRVPLDTIRDDRQNYTARRKDLVASTPKQYNADGSERVGSLGGAFTVAEGDEFQEMVDLWEIYLPRHKCLYVFADDDLDAAGGGMPQTLREFDWIGPEHGPYHYLEMIPVPGNCISKGPIQDVLDLNDAVNESYRKLRDQASREKEITVVTGGSTEDGKRIMDASDGQIISVMNADNTKVVRFGGISQVGLAAAREFKDLFVYLCGNLDIMGGLAPQSKTASQDKMLEANASKSMADMQDKTIESAAAITEAMCWFWWHDPNKTMRDVHNLPGLGDYSIPRYASPESRMMGSWDELDLRVDPYSLQHSTPEMRLAKLNLIVQQTLVPLMQLLQQQGIAFDVNKYIELVAKYSDMPEILEVTSVMEPPETSQSSSSDGPQMPGETTRNYVRESRPGTTRAGQATSVIDTLLGKGGGGGQRNGEMATNGAMQ
jgi:hypothetical protein